MAERTDDRITLRLDGPRVTADQFARAVNAFFDLLDEVSLTMTGSAKAVRWIISLEHGSNLLHAHPEVNQARVKGSGLVRAISSGVDLVGRRAQRPRYFTDSALRLARELSTVPDGHDIETAQIKTRPGKVNISPKIAGNVDRLLGEDVAEYGTIEGRLLTLSQRHKPHFAVYDPLTDQPIRCNVQESRLEEAWRAFGRRVAVSGIIRYRKTGQPVSIEAESMFIFPPDDELPSPSDVYGILGGAQ
ncbi:MAG: hypothetical protein ABI629_02425 [bacterium]